MIKKLLKIVNTTRKHDVAQNHSTDQEYPLGMLGAHNIIKLVIQQEFQVFSSEPVHSHLVPTSIRYYF